ncbi:unnamed protein product [Pleuronectes platessa]|uniref:Uncharacterized protein n=1 Tax=Pleuronectes platessa TaxID=8262 RepID=A0A9N7TV83_PLEPL|nr:unnamed protein product [Pleuronectes platessa]
MNTASRPHLLPVSGGKAQKVKVINRKSMERQKDKAGCHTPKAIHGPRYSHPAVTQRLSRVLITGREVTWKHPLALYITRVKVTAVDFVSDITFTVRSRLR